MRRRQDLYAYAAQVVGTRADAATERARAGICRQRARQCFDAPPLHVRLLYRLLRCQGADLDGVYAARAAVATDAHDSAHRSALELLDELIACGSLDRGLLGSRPAPVCPPASVPAG